MTNTELSKLSYQLRRHVLDMVFFAKAGHIGGDFSVCDILTCLYFRHMNVSPKNFSHHSRDRFILSKGHSVEALYAVLCEAGFFPKGDLETLGQFGTKYLGHPTTAVNGVEVNSGSLGHGLGLGVGMALAGKRDGSDYRVYAVMGDGELGEGSVWEAAMAAGHYKLDNLTAVVDRNRLQISGSTESVMSQDSQLLRWQSFGWNVLELDGNNIDALDAAFISAKLYKNKPTILIANTIKGCGVSFMEDSAGWHHRVPTSEEYELATIELATKERDYE